MINVLCVDDAGGETIQLTKHERSAVQKRLAQIEIALGHPRWTAKQIAGFHRERGELQRKLVNPSSH
jgi:hypothetical protein